jgi:hypothetical protein
MDQMTDLERLVAIEDIKQLKARRDRAVDLKQWDELEAMHAPDHQSHNEGMPHWNSARELIDNIKAVMDRLESVHHSHTPDITFESPTRAAGVWQMEDKLYWKQGGEDHWLHGMGFYDERYEKRDGRWVFVWRRLSRIKVLTSPGAIFPPPKA